MEYEVKATLKTDYRYNHAYYLIKSKTKNSFFYKYLGKMTFCKVDNFKSEDYFHKMLLMKFQDISEEDMIKRISEYVISYYRDSTLTNRVSNELKKEMNRFKEIKITVKIED